MDSTDSDLIATATYTRAQALADGTLLNADSLQPGIAREAGFLAPVALTAVTWRDCVHWDSDIEATKTEDTGQNSIGRLWDVLVMARRAAARGGGRAMFTVVRVPVDGASWTPSEAALWLHIGPGDLGEPVFTIMMSVED